MNDALDLGDAPHFWPTQGGSEVDFVLYRERGLWAFEVKNTAQVRPAGLRGLRAFLAVYPDARGVVIMRGRERERRGNVDGWHVNFFLRELPSIIG